MKGRQMLLAAGTIALPSISRAQAWPDRPVRFIVPYAPGGSTATSSRRSSRRCSASRS